MFTGIVEELGSVAKVDGSVLVLNAKAVLDDVELGSSIAVNGCCLTVVDWDEDEGWFQTDVVGVIVEPAPNLTIEMPEELSRYVVAKGSITVDGVSLTVNQPTGRRFSVAVIPHTIAVTTLGQKIAGHHVNLEVDVMAKYAESLLAGYVAGNAAESNGSTAGLEVREQL